MKRKFFAVMGSAVALSATLAGCGSAGTTGTSTNSSTGGANSSQSASIKFQIVWATDSGRGKAIQGILNTFEQQNPNIHVQLIGGVQHSSQQLLTEMLSGKAAEVVQIGYGDLQGMAVKNAFTSMPSSITSLQSSFYPVMWNLGNVNGTQYGVPWLGHTIELVYNETLFKKAGITSPPQTWDELYQDAKRLTNKSKNQYGIGLVGKQSADISWMMNMFVHQAGGKLVQKGANGNYEVAIDSPQSVQALDFYKKLVDQTAPPDTANMDGGGVMAAFRNQQVAMEFQGPWGPTDIWQHGNPFQVGTALVPAGPAGRAADVGPYMLAVPQGVTGQKLAAAEKLISYLESKPAQEMIFKGELGSDGKYYPFRVPIRKDLMNSSYLQSHPIFKPFVEGFKYPSISTPIPAWNEVDSQVYQSQLNEFVTGKETANQALNNIKTQGNKILQQAQNQ